MQRDGNDRIPMSPLQNRMKTRMRMISVSLLFFFVWSGVSSQVQIQDPDTSVKSEKDLIQDEKKRKISIYGEVLGIGVYNSVNLDVRIFKRRKGDGLGVRMGIGQFGAWYFPLQLNYLIGGPKGYLELASGATFATSNFDLGDGTYGSANWSVSSSIAFRFQPINKGFFLRVAADLFYELNVDRGDRIQPTGGLGIGYSF